MDMNDALNTGNFFDFENITNVLGSTKVTKDTSLENDLEVIRKSLLPLRTLIRASEPTEAIEAAEVFSNPLEVRKVVRSKHPMMVKLLAAHFRVWLGVLSNNPHGNTAAMVDMVMASIR